MIVQYPNFFGQLEDVEAIVAAAHARGALAIVIVDPISLGLLPTAGRIRRRHRGRRGAIARQRDEVRRALPGDHGLPRGVRAEDAGPDRRPDDRPPRQAVLGAHAPDPRAAHPPREGDLEHLHQPGTAGAPLQHLPGGDGPEGTAARRPNSPPARPIMPPSGWPRCRASPSPSPARSSRSSSSGLGETSRRSSRKSDASAITAGSPWAAGIPSSSDCILVAVTEKRTRDEIDGLAEAYNQVMGRAAK